MIPVRAAAARSIKSAMVSNMLKLGKYRHYKGKEYEVIGIAKHSETLNELVVYRALYRNKDLWVRPLIMFNERIEINGKKIRRFEHINNK